MRRFFYDTEFFERGPHYPINFISIGVISEHGEEFYRVTENAPWADIAANQWLRDNVLASLPGGPVPTNARWLPDMSHPSVVPLEQVREDLLAFLHPTADDPVELWAWYADYDHVVLSQLFGTMIQLPPGMPMYTHDLKQEIDGMDAMRGDSYWNDTVRDLMHSEGTEHNALDDARGVYRAFTGVRKLINPGIAWKPKPDTVTKHPKEGSATL